MTTEVYDGKDKYGNIVRTKFSVLGDVLIIEDGMVNESFIGGFSLHNCLEFDGAKLEMLIKVMKEM